MKFGTYAQSSCKLQIRILSFAVYGMQTDCQKKILKKKMNELMNL
jgi:hypothetical protein